MRLIDLNPKWVGVYRWAGNPDFRVGLVFDCPHCLTQRLAIIFTPPIDPDNEWDKIGRVDLFPNEKKWSREGDTFETITLTPSVDVSPHGHWHGFIEHGEVR